MQTKRQSWIEAGLNVLIGYAVALSAQLVVFPLLGIYIELWKDITIGIIFTVISLIRSYALRRLFNRLHR